MTLHTCADSEEKLNIIMEYASKGSLNQLVKVRLAEHQLYRFSQNPQAASEAFRPAGLLSHTCSQLKLRHSAHPSQTFPDLPTSDYRGRLVAII